MSPPTDKHYPEPEMSRRRGSFTQATLGNLFQRANTTISVATPPFPNPAMPMSEHRRRLSLSTGAGVGLSGTSPTSPFLRRASVSTTTSDSIDEHAVADDDDSPGFPSRSPFQRRMSFGGAAAASMRGGTRAIPPSPSAHDQGFNWSEQLRSRAENLTMVAGGAARPGVPRAPSSTSSTSSSNAPRAAAAAAPPATKERAKSVAEMPSPPAQASAMRPPPSRKPDPFQERILKGDFYMD